MDCDVKSKYDFPSIEDVITLELDMKRFARPSAKKDSYRMVSIVFICTHCRGIISFANYQ